VGLFRGITNTWKKSEAAALIEKLLEIQKEQGMFTLDPATAGNMLVAKEWDKHPDYFDGRRGPRPHKVTVAAAAMMPVIVSAVEADKLTPNIMAMVACVAQILADIGNHPKRYELNRKDEHVLVAYTNKFEEMQPKLSQYMSDEFGMTDEFMDQMNQLAGGASAIEIKGDGAN
jgi:hypothetical protein